MKAQVGDELVLVAQNLTDLARVLSLQIAFPWARDEPQMPVVVET